MASALYTDLLYHWMAGLGSSWVAYLPCILDVQCYVSDITSYTPLLTVDMDGFVRTSLNVFPFCWLPMSRRLNRE